MAYLHLIRFPNLLIVVLTQFLFQYLLVVPALQAGGIEVVLDLFHFSLLVLSTVLIAAGGYVINDLTDFPVDQINKPHKVIIQRSISFQQAWNYYYALTAVGFVISLYLAWYVENLPLVLIYPAAVCALYWYSVKLKATVLWGNMVVSIFCAFVVGIVLFAERHSIAELIEVNPIVGQHLLRISMAYLGFAFLSTMFREVIKDLEDLLGDEAGDCRTLPVVFGVRPAKIVAFFFGLSLFLLIAFWGKNLWLENQWWPLAFLSAGIAAPLLFALIKLYGAQQKNAFHFLSQLTKYIILSGLLFLFALGY